jgi:hypothetical protein
MADVACAFLLYDSRSGSTFLSRELGRACPDLLVTPEISFRPLLLVPDPVLAAGGTRLARRILSGRSMANIGLGENELATLLAGLARPLSRGGVMRAIAGWHADHEGTRRATMVLVKSGEHIFHVRRLLSELPDARFVYLYRDPRAVISSKLRTRRPYYPREAMAWGGSLLAALQWRAYCKTIDEFQVSTACKQVAYEKLVTRTDSTVAEIAVYLGVGVGGASGREYHVPEAERSIHPRVFANGISQDRLTAWHDELSRQDELVIQRLLMPVMADRGYVVRFTPGLLELAGAFARALIKFGVGAARHAGYHTLVALRRRIGRVRGSLRGST